MKNKIKLQHTPFKYGVPLSVFLENENDFLIAAKVLKEYDKYMKSKGIKIDFVGNTKFEKNNELSLYDEIKVGLEEQILKAEIKKLIELEDNIKNLNKIKNILRGDEIDKQF